MKHRPGRRGDGTPRGRHRAEARIPHSFRWIPLAFARTFGQDRHMTADELRTRVAQHYSASQEPLLLSNFGKELRLAGLWPKEEETRTLANVIRELAPELSIVADPDAKAFVVITPAGREDIAHAAFERRHDLLLLKRLPRAVLLAFCANTKQPVRLSATPPFRYSTNDPPPNDGYVLVDAELRTPGLFIDETLSLPPDDAQRLLSGLKEWARRHSIDLVKMASQPPPPPSSRRPPAKLSANALERLYEAQPQEWRDRLVVPVDIALALSRMP